MEANNPFGRGQYNYPIQFQLPAGMPGTFVHKSGHGSRLVEATVQYNMYVEMVADGHEIGRAWTPIIVMQGSRRQQM